MIISTAAKLNEHQEYLSTWVPDPTDGADKAAQRYDHTAHEATRFSGPKGTEDLFARSNDKPSSEAIYVSKPPPQRVTGEGGQDEWLRDAADENQACDVVTCWLRTHPPI